MHTKMKFTVLKALLLPIALLTLGTIDHASAATCNSSYTMAAVTTPGFTCTFNFLTFSNFNYLPSVSLMPGCGDAGEPACPPETTPPDPALDITVNFSLMTSGSDGFGTFASPGNPITQVITDYSAGNSVNEFQNEMGVVQYLVTGVGSSVITEVDAAITGLATDRGNGRNEQILCVGMQFGGGIRRTAPVPGRSTWPRKSSGPDRLPRASRRTARLISNRFCSRAQACTTNGTGRAETPAPTSTANVTAVENDFVYRPPPAFRNPAPLCCWAAGLVSINAFRRKKSL